MGVDAPFFLNYYIYSNRKYRQGITMSYSTDSFYISDDNKDYIKSKVEQEKAKGNKRFNKSNFIDDLLTHLRERAESKPSQPSIKQEMQYPAELNIEAWNEWKAYRRENKMKAYKPTPRSEGVAVNNLIKLSKGDHNTQMLIVHQSMANTWTGLFEVKGNEANKQTTNTGGLSATKRAMLEARHQRDSAQSGSPLGFNDGVVHGQVGEEKWDGRVIDMD